MRIKFSYVAAATLALVASVGALATANPVSAVSPTTAAGTVNITPTGTPTANTSATNYSLTPPAGAACQGNADSGYNASTYIIPAANTAAQIEWVGGQATIPGVTEGIGTLALSAGGGSPQFSVGLDPSTFAITFPSSWSTNGFRFSNYTIGFFSDAHLNGAYKVGVACYGPTGAGGATETTRYWEQTLTLTFLSGAGPGNFNWVVGLPTAAPAAPVVTASQSGPGTVSASWTEPVANPTVTTYDVTLKQGATTIGTPQLGLTTLSTTFSLVPNGVGYTVEVVAHNTVGASPAGVSSSFSIVAGAQGAPTLSVAPGANAGELLASWSIPTGLTPNGYSLSVETGGLGGTDITDSPFTVTTGTSKLVTGLTAGTAYTFRVTATYADGSAVASPSNVVTASPAAADSLQQVIQVERPNGALILTQRCGVHGALPAEAVDAGFPGFPAVGAIAEDQAGAFAPTLVPGGGDDPEFPDYPFADPDVKTQCIVDLGPAVLLTSGDLAGQYYAADGALNEVTIVDTRQGDNGWTVSGSIPSLSNGGSGTFDSFSGSLVGWTPKVSDTTGGASQVVTPGAAVVPGDSPGLSSATGQVLAHANAGAGLGIAVLDARIKVLIPLANNNGDYSGILTINAA